MTHSSRVLQLTLVLSVLIPAALAPAQQRIPNELITQAGAFNTAAEERIGQWVNPWTKQLIAGESPARIAEAREKLQEPTRQPGITAEFRRFYSQVVEKALMPALGGDSALVRQNALIVSAHLASGYGIQMFIKALNDAHPAVRYWAAKGAAMATADENLLPTQVQQKTLLDALSAAMEKESIGPVVEQMYLALSGLRLPDARDQLLRGLELRAGAYAKQGLNVQVRGELAAIRRIYKVLLVESVRDQAQPGQVRQLVKSAAKYLQVTQRAVGQGVDPSLQPIVMEMVELIEQVLNWGVKHFNAGAGNGPALMAPLRSGDTATFQLHVNDWVGVTDQPGLLTTSRLAIPQKELLLTQP